MKRLFVTERFFALSTEDQREVVEQARARTDRPTHLLEKESRCMLCVYSGFRPAFLAAADHISMSERSVLAVSAGVWAYAEGPAAAVAAFNAEIALGVGERGD